MFKKFNLNCSTLDRDYPMISQMVLELGHRRSQIINAIIVQLNPNIKNEFDEDAIEKTIQKNYGCQCYQKYYYVNDTLSEIDSCRHLMLFKSKIYDMKQLNSFSDYYEPFNNSYLVNTDNIDVDTINCEILSVTKEQEEDEILKLMYDNYSELESPFDDTEMRFVLDIKDAIENYYSRCIKMRDELNEKCELNIG